MDLMLGLTAASQALEIVQRLRDISKGLDEAETKLQLAELYGKLADVKVALADAKVGLQEKDESIRDLTDRLAFKAELVELDGFKYRKGPDGKPVGKPFCPACEVKYGQFYQIAFGAVVHDRTCPNCRYKYGTEAKQIRPGDGGQDL